MRRCLAPAISVGREGYGVARARSLSEFQTSFPDETSGAAFLCEILRRCGARYIKVGWTAGATLPSRPVGVVLVVGAR